MSGESLLASAPKKRRRTAVWAVAGVAAVLAGVALVPLGPKLIGRSRHGHPRPALTGVGLEHHGEIEISLVEEVQDARHARTATGVAQLPFGAAVQLEMILRMAEE